MSLSKNYIITEQIGAGAMATVHKSIQKSLERLVAIKQILPHLAKDPDFVIRFQREAKAAAGLHHENIVGIIDFGNEGDNHYIIVEYIDGPTLRDLMLTAGKKMPVPVVVSIAIQMLNGLEHSHNKGIVHRDLKPANIMLTHSGMVKITDFGIAHAVDLPSLTSTGKVLGTPAYMSPEQANGQKIDHRSDLFSIGVVIYEMLTGIQPFQGTTIYNLIKNVVSEPHRPIKEVNPSVPDELAGFVDKALEKEMVKRFFDATEFAYALENFAFGAGIKFGPRVVKEFIESTIGTKEVSEDKFTTSQVAQLKPTTLGGKQRPTVAILPLQGCFGCHVNLLDLHERFEEITNNFDVQFTYLMDVKQSPKVDIALVEGCVANNENAERLKQMRSNCGTLIALGSCACFGGIPGLRNLYSADQIVARAYQESESTCNNGVLPHTDHVPTLTSLVSAVPDVVKVDYAIPGCPSPRDLVVSALTHILEGTNPNLPTRAVCSECGRVHQSLLSPKKEFIAANINPIMTVDQIDETQCFLEQGILCMGMVTMEGCKARCLKSNFPCQGCMGPAPEVKDTGAKWINTMGSLLPSGAMRFRDDIVGFGYRYTLPVSMMPGNKSQRG
jgi:serine/threonine protein kinase